MDSMPEQKTQEPLEKRPRHSGALWGLILVALGIIFLAQRLGWVGDQFNWWAIFILIPAFGSFSSAFFAFQKTGRFNTAVRSSIGGGLVTLTVALLFMFGLDWSKWWPMMVIMPGFSMFLTGFGDSSPSHVNRYLNLLVWFGLAAIYLGVGFLLQNLGLYSVSALFGAYKWWAVAILIPAFGAFVNAAIAAAKAGRFTGSAFGLVLFGIMAGATGVVALIGISWNLLGPILLILVGITILLGIFGRNKE